MNVHHVKSDDDTICNYCGERLNATMCTPVHEGTALYKRCPCQKCGTDNLIKMPFMGDGNDRWGIDPEGEPDLDMKVRAAESDSKDASSPDKEGE